MIRRLRYRNQDIDLPLGRFVIGRGADAQLSLDDPLVSRHHAALTVTSTGVSVEDLGSRNGTLVNDARIGGVTVLVAGDHVTIGSQRMELLDAGGGSSADRVTRVAVTRRFDRLGIVGELARKALGLGRADEAERLIGQALRDIVEEVESGADLNDDQTTKAADFAVQLAEHTGKASWVDYTVRLYRARSRPLPGPVIDRLHEVLRKVGPIDLAALRAYLGELREGSARLGPAERFLLSRIEGLERMASLR